MKSLEEQDEDYRIKPEPMEFWVNVIGGKLSEGFETFEKARDAVAFQPIKTIKVRRCEMNKEDKQDKEDLEQLEKEAEAARQITDEDAEYHPEDESKAWNPD
jgi:hypothetical protein